MFPGVSREPPYSALGTYLGLYFELFQGVSREPPPSSALGTYLGLSFELFQGVSRCKQCSWYVFRSVF